MLAKLYSYFSTTKMRIPKKIEEAVLPLCSFIVSQFNVFGRESPSFIVSRFNVFGGESPLQRILSLSCIYNITFYGDFVWICRENACVYQEDDGKLFVFELWFNVGSKEVFGMR